MKPPIVQPTIQFAHRFPLISIMSRQKVVPKRLNYLIAPSNSTYIKKVTDCRVLDDGWLQGTVKREEAFEAKS